jgi:hypothetical protein
MASRLLRKERSSPFDQVRNGKIDPNGNYVGFETPDLEDYLIDGDAYDGMTAKSDLQGLVQATDSYNLKKNGLTTKSFGGSLNSHLARTKTLISNLAKNKKHILDMAKHSLSGGDGYGAQYSSGDPRSYMEEVRGGADGNDAWYSKAWDSVKNTGKWVYDNKDTIIPIVKAIVSMVGAGRDDDEVLGDAIMQGAGKYFLTHRESKLLDNETADKYYDYLKGHLTLALEQKRPTKLLTKTLLRMDDVKKLNEEKPDRLRKKTDKWRDEFENKKKAYREDHGIVREGDTINVNKPLRLKPAKKERAKRETKPFKREKGESKDDYEYRLLLHKESQPEEVAKSEKLREKLSEKEDRPFS